MSTIKEPAVAGQFYEDSPELLRREIRQYLDEASTPPAGKPVVGIIVPHAGYVYSGPVAAHAYRHVEGLNYDTVIVFGLSHRVPCRASILEADSYRTPFGLIPIDRELVKAIQERMPDLGYQPSVHRSEHSVEVQIPFIQTVLPQTKIVEILLQSDDSELCSELTRAVAEAVQAFPTKRILIVGSTDMSHYQSYQEAYRIDRQTLEALKTLDIPTIRRTIDTIESSFSFHDCAVCSHGAVYAALETMKRLGGNAAEVLLYRNSGDAVPMEQTGGRVVGYGAMAIYHVETAETHSEDLGMESSKPEHLTEEQQRRLLQMARSAIQDWLRGQSHPTSWEESFLRLERGLFVSLHIHGALRGCLGRFEADGIPLGELVPIMACEAAAHDPRFAPVKAEELSDIDIEISILTPMRKIENPEEVIPGKHGLYMVGRNAFGFERHGTLLPQVATDHGWDRETFLRQTCIKAGLDTEAWHSPQTDIYVYEAQVFGERELGLWPPGE